jgi:hypothetical protein
LIGGGWHTPVYDRTMGEETFHNVTEYLSQRFSVYKCRTPTADASFSTVMAVVAVAVVVVDVVVVALVGAGLVPKLQFGFFSRLLLLICWRPTQRDNFDWGQSCAQHADAGNATKWKCLHRRRPARSGGVVTAPAVKRHPGACSQNRKKQKVCVIFHVLVLAKGSRLCCTLTCGSLLLSVGKELGIVGNVSCHHLVVFSLCRATTRVYLQRSPHTGI